MVKGKRTRKYLTLEQLKKMNACSGAISEFKISFGKKAAIFQVVERLHEIKATGWEAWLLAQAPALTKSLLKHGADIHAREDIALYWASVCGHTETVKVLLKYGVVVHNDEALRGAVRCGYTEIVKILKRAMKKK